MIVESGCRMMFVLESPGLHGAPTQALLLIPALKRLGVYACLAIPEGHTEFAKMAAQSGIDCWQLRMHRLRNSVNPVIALRWVIHLLPTLHELERLIRRERVNVVYASELHEFLGPLAARMSGARVIWRTANLFRYGVIGIIFRWLAKMCADYVVPVAKAVEERQFGVHSRVSSKIVRIPVSVDCQRFSPDADSSIAAELGRKKGEVWICQIANVYPPKGTEYFIRAAALVREHSPVPVKFIHVGSRLDLHTGYYEAICSEIKLLGLEKDLLLLGARKDIPQVLNCCDMLIVSSVLEGQPAVCLEAMACAKPVVATRVGGIPETVIDGETGLLVPARDAGALANAILKLVRDPKLARVLGRAGQERVLTLHAVDICAGRLATLAKAAVRNVHG